MTPTGEQPRREGWRERQAESCPTCGSDDPSAPGWIAQPPSEYDRRVGESRRWHDPCPDPFHSKPTDGLSGASADVEGTERRSRIEQIDAKAGPAESVEGKAGGEAVTLVRAKGLRLWEEVLPEEVEAKRSDDRYEVRTFVPESSLNAALQKLAYHKLEEATEGKPFGECSHGELLEACRWFWMARDAALARAEEAEKKHQWAHEQRARAETAREEAERARDALGDKLGGMRLDRNAERRMRKDAESVIERVRKWAEQHKHYLGQNGPLHEAQGRKAAALEILSLLNPKESEHE